MSRRTKVIVVLAILAVGLTSFMVTLSNGETESARNRPPLDRWLDLSPTQAASIQSSHPNFPKDAAALSADLQGEREKLATMLDDGSAPDDRIIAQVERVSKAHAALERRVAQHILAIRKHLTAAQQKRLMGLCARGVRNVGGSHPKPAHGSTGPATRQQSGSTPTRNDED